VHICLTLRVQGHNCGNEEDSNEDDSEKSSHAGDLQTTPWAILG